MQLLDRWWHVLITVTDTLDALPVAHCVVEDAALVAQGVALPALPPITLLVQWDLFADVYRAFTPYAPGAVVEEQGGSRFDVTLDDVPISIGCRRNTVVATDPERIAVERDQRVIWAKSLLFYKRHLPPSDPRVEQIRSYLRRQQRELNAANARAWNRRAYEAWVERHGPPEQLAAQIRRAPAARLTALRRFLGDPKGQKIANLLGSYGGKAVALALLGADVTVVDIAPDNARYALALALAAGTTIRYVVADVLELPGEELSGDYDLVLMEQGILHYFLDLEPLADVVARLLKPRGRLVLHEFHPVSTKLITSKGRKHKVTGNYFSAALDQTEVAYAKHLADAASSDRPHVRLRRWTLGETVTAFAGAGLCVRELVEEPNTKIDDVGLPKTFTLVAEKQ